MKNPFIVTEINPLVDDDDILHHLSNHINLVEWFKEEPDIDSLRRAAILEARDKKRMPILSRVLSRILKLERARISQALMS